MGPKKWYRAVCASSVLSARPGQHLTAAHCRWDQFYLFLNLFSVPPKPKGGGQAVEGGTVGLPGLGSVLGVGQHAGSGASQCPVSFSEHCAGAHLSCEEDVAGTGGWR